jgi:hypothetical protein
MMVQGDTNRPRSVKLEIDPDFRATAMAGAAPIEQTLRSLGLRKLLAAHLPARGERAAYGSADFAQAAIAAMLLGGDGMDLFEPLRQDSEARRFSARTRLPATPRPIALVRVGGPAPARVRADLRGGGPAQPWTGEDRRNCWRLTPTPADYDAAPGCTLDPTVPPLRNNPATPAHQKG